MRRSVLLTVALLGACNPFKLRAPKYPSLEVTAKEGVSVLVSRDARCLVPTKQFAMVTVGQPYACNWRDHGAVVPMTASVAPAKKK
ncbi:MAG: hypothetical protein ABJB66_11420 [Gemmatimonadaceae bacterium]